MPKITNANQLTQYATKVLNRAGYTCWRQNNGGVWDEARKAYRSNGTLKGVSDILGYHRTTGRFLACEIKAGKDRLSEAQRVFLTGVADAGGLALVVRHTDDLASYLTGEGDV